MRQRQRERDVRCLLLLLFAVDVDVVCITPCMAGRNERDKTVDWDCLTS